MMTRLILFVFVKLKSLMWFDACCESFSREKCLKSDGFWLCDERFELIQFEWEIFENFIIEKTNIEYQY